MIAAFERWAYWNPIIAAILFFYLMLGGVFLIEWLI